LQTTGPQPSRVGFKADVFFLPPPTLLERELARFHPKQRSPKLRCRSRLFFFLRSVLLGLKGVPSRALTAKRLPGRFFFSPSPRLPHRPQFFPANATLEGAAVCLLPLSLPLFSAAVEGYVCDAPQLRTRRKLMAVTFFPFPFFFCKVRFCVRFYRPPFVGKSQRPPPFSLPFPREQISNELTTLRCQLFFSSPLLPKASLRPATAMLSRVRFFFGYLVPWPLPKRSGGSGPLPPFPPLAAVSHDWVLASGKPDDVTPFFFPPGENRRPLFPFFGAQVGFSVVPGRTLTSLPLRFVVSFADSLPFF